MDTMDIMDMLFIVTKASCFGLVVKSYFQKGVYETTKFVDYYRQFVLINSFAPLRLREIKKLFITLSSLSPQKKYN